MKLWDAHHKQLARQVFGRPVRVLLAAWVLERGGEAFFQSMATAGLQPMGEVPSAVVQELERFVEWQLLVRTEPGDRRVWYTPQRDAPLWAVFAAAAAAFELGVKDDALHID